jgi:hypothetical protein
MMEDFHDSARRAGEALDAATSVDAEAQATERGEASSGVATPQAPTGAGASTSGSATPQAATGGGPTRWAQRLHRQPMEGGCPVGLRCSLSDTTPSQRSEDAIAIYATSSRTRPTTRGLHRGRQQQ